MPLLDMRCWLSVLFLFLAGGTRAADHYVDISSRGGPADDAGPGTLQRPWRTLSRIAAEQEPCPRPGDTIWVRGGVYQEEVNLRTGGTANRPLTIRAFPGERPMIDGEGRRQQGLRLPSEGRADHVVIEGLTLMNSRAGGVGLSVSGRTGVILRGVEVTGAGTGVALHACTQCQLLQSHVHHCQGNNVLIDSSCSDLIIADNHIHHSASSHALSIYAPGDGVRGQGSVVSVERHGPGLARFTTEKLELNKVRDGTLKGQDGTRSVPNPGLILLFPDRNPEPDGQPLAGGTVRLQDGRHWFALRNNSDWGGKPYAPDGRTGLFEIGQADMQTLARAKSVYVAYTFSPAVANRDIQVLRNEVDHAAVQGIWVQRSEGVLLQGNRTHHNGATGIQIESLCRRVWVDGNVSYANSIFHGHETGIWLDETIDAVVQNNVAYENQKGMGVTQCEWVLVRRNVIHHNQAQHVTQNRDGCRGNAGGFWYSGGRHNHLGAPPGAQHNAFVHNTLYANGTEISSWGGIQHGISGYPRIGPNRICNNIVQNTLGEYVVHAGGSPALLDGNVYYGKGPDAGAFEFGLAEPSDQPEGPVRDDGEGAVVPRPQTYQRWEHALASTRNYENPYADVTVRVSYIGPGGRTLRTYGFWDGGDAFRIRCAFPVAGTWQWETECSDAANPGLHRQRGKVDVLPYRGDCSLYRHGFLKVSENRRHLVYGDGTPFLWMGDTAWAVPHRATDEEWAAYLTDRTAKHFTLLQVAPAPAWAGPSDRRGERPFTDNTCSQWNPAYWQSFEQKVQRANEAGLVVLLVGLMEPVHRYPESDKACLFARNIVARLFGNFVIFSPSFDSEFMPLANEVGRAARAATAVHLITQHPGTPWNQPTPTISDKYYDEPYLDIAAVQTGHNAGHLDWCAHHAIEWVLHLYRHEPHKPVINLEAMYDAQGEKGWRAVDARSLAWRTWLSGAMGYTYGAGDVPPKVPPGSGAIWKWVTDPEKYDYWKKALQWDSVFQMRYLHDFLAALEWWRLEPAHDLIRNQPQDVTRRMVLAKTGAGDLAVAYLPNNEAIEIDVSAFPTPLKGRWFDPVQGGYTLIADRIENKGTRRLSPPGQGDGVLLFEKVEE